ncbi:integrase, catalytic region, zinc finger, CCHC-type containing protein [Tanacetum coccineum]
MKVEESLNVTFNESPSPTKLSPLVDDDVGEDEAIENNIKLVNNTNIENESIKVDKFEMSMMGELNFFLGLQIKQMEDGIFFNQSKYIKEMLKKFGLEDSKPTKTPMSTEIKLTKDDEADSVDSTKYQETFQPTSLSSSCISLKITSILQLVSRAMECFKNYFKTQQPHIQTQFLSTTDRSISNLFDTTLSMTTLADKSLLSGGDNKPPMLEKHLYDSWKSRMELYMMNRPNGRMILASVEKGPLVWPSITMDGVTRLKEYTELTPAEAIQADCDIKAINIILQGLPTEIYALVSQHHVAKDLWRRGNCSTQGTSITKQRRECKLYDEFDKFTYKKGESLHEYYLRFTLLLNDMNIYKMPLEQFQVNTKFLNTLPMKWINLLLMLNSGLIVPVFQKGDDPIDAINHMMSFLTAVVTSRYPTTNNQLRNSSNPRQQATINNGRKAQQSKPKLYVGDIIVQTNPIEIPDSKETLALAEESRSKMLLKHKDNMMLEKEKLWNEHRIESKTMKLRMNQVLNEKNDSENKVMSKDIVTYLFNPIRGDDSVNDKIKQDLEEIETINIELDHRVTKLIAENDHLKQTYKQLYDSIKPARIRSKEQCDDLINQVNIKSAEISDLNVSLQEKALAITALQDELKKLKGKALVDNNVSNHPSDPELHQVNVEPITPKLLNKRTAHSAYIKHSQEEATVLRDLVDHIKAKLIPISTLRIFLPTGWTFTIVGNAYHLTRITTTTKVPLRKSSALDNKTPKPVGTLVYSRKPRKSKTSVPVNNYKVIKSVTANNSEPSQSKGSIVSNVPSSSLDECMSSKLSSSI